jgi:DNA-binding MarR family transcriptional regulator
VWRALAALELAAVRHRGAVRARLRLSDEALSALLHLAHHGDVAQGRLPAVTGLSRSGTGALVHRLERAGLVERRADPDDRRLRRVALSAAGRAAVARAYAPLDTAVTALLAERPAGELDRLEQLLDGLVAAATGALSGHVAQPAEPPGPPPGDPIWRRWA